MSAYDLIGDMANEDAHIADAVLAWKRERAQATVRAAIARERKASLDAAWESLLARSRAHDPEGRDL